MKRFIKYVIVTAFVFFIGNISVKAEATMCEYRLPYLGLNINQDVIVNKSEKIENSYFTVRYQKSNDGYILDYTNYMGKSPFRIVATQKFDNYLNNNNECPGYVNVMISPWQVAKKSAFVPVTSPLVLIIKELDDSSGIATMDVSDESTFNTNIKKNSNNGTTIPSMQWNANFIIPLYQSTIDGKTSFSSATQKSYINNTLHAWASHMDSIDKNGKTACGSNWATIKKSVEFSGNVNNNNKDCMKAISDYTSSVNSLALYVKAVGDDSKIKQVINSKYKSEFNKLNSYVKAAGLSSEYQEISNELQDAYDEKNELLNNRCSVYCLNLTGTARNECEKSAIYTKCYSCYYTNNPCASYNGTAKEECMKTVDYKGCMGEEDYNNLQSTYNEELNRVQDLINEKKNELTSISAPSLNGITFEPYKAQCSDFSILHKFWNIITIIAPIITILFGVLDYSAAVIASNEEKMNKAKKKFPKRLLAAIILLIVPLLIRIILGIFTVDNAGIESAGDTSILRCIVNGE